MTRSHLGHDPIRLRGLLEDTLRQDEEQALLDHLGGCADCQHELERMAADGVWWDRLRRFAPRDRSTTDAGTTGPTSARDEAADDDATLGFLAPTDDPRFVGRLGRYEVTGIIGRGGMGLVLRAFDPPLNRYVAIKVLAPELATSGAARKRFAREAKAAAAVAHEHVVPIYAVDEVAGLPYLVMPYIAGRSLRERLRRDGPMGLEETLRVGMQAAQGLAAAHALGLVHRDVKPANILMEDGVERVKLSDFGLARAVDDASFTQSGVVTGTPEYMSPEQARGESVDQRADLFSLGGVLYTMCTGHAPFRAPTSLAVLRRVCDDRHRPIRESNPSVPAWLEEIVDRLLAKDPADRFARADEVADLLGRHLARVQDPSLPEVPHSWVQAAAASSRRRAPGRVIAAGLAVALAVGTSSWFLLQPTPTEGPPRGGIAEAPAPEPDPARLKASFEQDFRGKSFNPRALKVAAWNTERMLRPERGGLLVTVPATKGKFYRVGVATRFRVRGDFDITASYEVLKSDVPRDGYGLGFMLSVQADSPENTALDVENSDAPLKRGDDSGRTRRIYNATLLTGPNTKRSFSPGSVPAKFKAGSLRITRVGSTACAWYSAAGAPFQLLRQVEFGSEDLTYVQVGANLGGSGHALDVLVHDLRIRAEELPGLAGSPTPSSPAPWRAVGIVAAVILVPAIGVWWVATSRRRAPAPEPPRPSKSPAKAQAPARTLAPPDGWDETGLRTIEEKARAYARLNPEATVFDERPRYQFSLAAGRLHGAFTAWEELGGEDHRRPAQNPNQGRTKLPVRLKGSYLEGDRDGVFVLRGQDDRSITLRFRKGELVRVAVDLDEGATR